MRHEEEIIRLLREILRRLTHHPYHVLITQEGPMAIGNITAGTSGTFAAQLLDAGSPISLPSGTTFVWSASDSTVSIVQSADTTSAVITVPPGDAGTTLTVTASTTDPAGNPQSGSITVELTPVPQTFSVTVAQTA